MIVVGILSILLVCITPVALIVLVIAAISKKNKDNNGKFEEMIRNVYVYIILIVTLVAIISGTITTFRIGLDILLPEKSTYEYSYSSQEREKNENIIELYTTISLVIAVIPVFIYHNKLAKENRIIKSQESKV